jgi:hypothetical protein
MPSTGMNPISAGFSGREMSKTRIPEAKLPARSRSLSAGDPAK